MNCTVAKPIKQCNFSIDEISKKYHFSRFFARSNAAHTLCIDRRVNSAVNWYIFTFKWKLKKHHWKEPKEIEKPKKQTNKIEGTFFISLLSRYIKKMLHSYRREHKQIKATCFKFLMIAIDKEFSQVVSNHGIERLSSCAASAALKC